MGDPQALEKLDLPRDRPVVTICPRGKASALAAEQLQARGYDVRNLVGGLKAWSLAWNTAEMTLPDQAATVIQVRRTGKGCLSYLVGSDGETAVNDRTTRDRRLPGPSRGAGLACFQRARDPPSCRSAFSGQSVGTGDRSGPLSSCARARIVRLPAVPRGHTHRYWSNVATGPRHTWPYAREHQLPARRERPLQWRQRSSLPASDGPISVPILPEPVTRPWRYLRAYNDSRRYLRTSSCCRRIPANRSPLTNR